MKTWNIYEVSYKYRIDNALKIPEVRESKVHILAGDRAQALHELKTNHKVNISINHIMRVAGPINWFADEFMQDMEKKFIKYKPISKHQDQKEQEAREDIENNSFVKQNKGYSIPFKSFWVKN